jgi:hypothetical protein
VISFITPENLVGETEEEKERESERENSNPFHHDEGWKESEEGKQESYRAERHSISCRVSQHHQPEMMREHTRSLSLSLFSMQVYSLSFPLIYIYTCAHRERERHTHTHTHIIYPALLLLFHFHGLFFAFNGTSIHPMLRGYLSLRFQQR